MSANWHSTEAACVEREMLGGSFVELHGEPLARRRRACDLEHQGIHVDRRNGSFPTDPRRHPACDDARSAREVEDTLAASRRRRLDEPIGPGAEQHGDHVALVGLCGIAHDCVSVHVSDGQRQRTSSTTSRLSRPSAF
jgi:hypothetical protein